MEPAVVDAFFNNKQLVALGPEWLMRLKAETASSTFGRTRFCLHRSTADAIQEMLIVYRRDSLVKPHRHQGKSESYHVIEGEALILIFGDDGQVIERLHLGPPASGLRFSARIDSPMYHCTVPLTDFFCVVEVTSGPFDKAASESDMAPWAPTDPEELAEFLAVAADDAGTRAG